MMSVRAGILVLVSSLFLSGTAFAGTKDDIRALQAQVAQLQQTLAGQSQATVRISQLERQIQNLTGEVERLQYELDQANTRLDAVSAVLVGQPNPDAVYGFPADGASRGGGPVDLMARGSQGGDPMGNDPIADRITQQAQAPGGQPVDVSDVSLPLDPNAAFDYASGFILAGDYQRAKSAFALYLEAFPNHQRTPDAQFRLGEIHLALEENAAAADAFIAHIRNYPNNGRAAEAYLKLGTAFARLDKPTEACTVFKTMKSKHPNASAAVVQRADLEMARIDCK